MTTVKSPTDICLRITWTPPTTITSPVPRIVMALTMSEKIDCCHVSAIRELIVWSPARAYRCFS